MKRLILGVSMAAVLALGPLAWAQGVVTPTSQTQATTPTTDPAALAVADTVKVPVFPQVETLLPSDTPLPVKFGLGAQVIEGVDPALTSGVTFEGYARKVEVPVQDGTSKIGQILVMAVSKDERVETIDAQGLQAQFEANDDSLFPDKAVEVEGNRAALIAALQRLAGEPVTEEEPAKAEADNGTSGADGADGVGSNAAQNDPLANYQAPAMEATAEKEPVVSMDVTTEGCQVRVDEAQGLAIQQNRSVTMEDGVVTDKGQCSDGDKRFPLQKSYAACPDTVSVSTLSATANFQSYYVDDGGTTHTVGDCQPDSDAHFTISETTDGCTNSIDLNAGTVTVNTALVYSDRNGKVIQVRGCQPSSTKASISLSKTFGQCADKVNLAAKVVYPQYVQTYKDANGTSHTVSDCTPDIEQAKAITEDTKACTVRVDLASGQVVPQAALVYTNSAGQSVQVRGCQDAEASAPIALVKVYEACTDKVDLAALTATARYQLAYTANGSTQTVSECQPDTSAVSAITEDTKACTVRVDLATGKAIPQAALVYTDRTGKVVQVRGCQDATGTASIALERDYEACSDLVNLTGLTVTPQYQQTYKAADGSTVVASSCTPDAAKATAIQKSYDACADKVDTTAGTASRQYQLTYADEDGTRQTLSECRTDDESTVALVQNYDACADVVDLESLTAIRQYQLSYTDSKGVEHAVSKCQPDTTAVFAIAEDTSACPVKIDLANNQVVPQAVLSYVDAKGKTVQVRGCAASVETAATPLTKSYEACTDVVDVAALTATRRYQLTYTDKDGSQQAVSECQPDSAAVFPISEDVASCPVKIDLANTQVVPQAVLSYVDAKGKTVQVRGCAASVETAATPLTKSYEACTDVVDVAALTATRRYQLTYTDRDGSQQTVSECQPDSGAIFPITEDPASCPVKIDLVSGKAIPQAVLSYQDANGKTIQVRGCAPATASAVIGLEKSYGACSDLIDLDALTATPRYQMTYTADGNTQVVSDCQPDPSAVITITEDTKACDMAVDLDALTATPQGVLVYTDRNGKQVQVRGCGPVSNGQQVTLKQSYDACTILVDLGAAQAVPRYTLTYKDTKGLPHTVADCTPDGTKAVPIVEKVADCPVDVDLVAKVATVQSVLSYTTAEGEEVQVRGCAASSQEDPMPLTKTYGACADKVDLTALTAWAQYQWAYLDGKGALHTVTDCAPDDETAFPITENTSACPVDVEVSNQRAVIQSVLVYKDRAGKTVQAQDCQPSLSIAPVPMTQDTSSCPLRHDFPGSDVSGLGITTGQSVEQGMWVYTLDGQAYQATPCLETGRTFPHTTVTTANGAYICNPIVVGASVTIQGRTQITVDGLKQYITECAPVDSAEQTLQSTTDGCTDISAWSHDIASGVSYGQERFFYNKPNGQREYVTDCQTSATAYLHNHQQSGWDYHDEGLYAYPLETVSIKVGGIDQVIAIGQLLPGTPQMPYVKYGVMNQGTGDYSYEGCTKYEQTEQVTAWTRPDGSTYTQPIGPGPMTDLGDACIYFPPSSTDAWEYKRLVSAGYENWRCQYEGTRTVIREDGETVSQTTATQGMSAPTVCSGAGGSQTCNYQCPAHPPLSEVSQWLTELGW